MKTHRDHLDDAIDITTARMTAVAEDDGLAIRIAQALPDRRAGLIWILAAWAPRLAVVALGAIAVTVVLRTFEGRPTVVGPAEAGHHNASVARAEAGPSMGTIPTEVRGPRVSVESAFRRTTSRTTAAVDRPDHEFSLPPIAAVAALDVDTLISASLPEDEPLTVAPLTISDLPLGGESSPR